MREESIMKPGDVSRRVADRFMNEMNLASPLKPGEVVIRISQEDLFKLLDQRHQIRHTHIEVVVPDGIVRIKREEYKEMPKG